MHTELVLPGEISALIHDPTYRVVLWNRPQREGMAWFRDEWQVEDAGDVREVIAWAEAQEATTFEVLVVGGEGQSVGCVRVAGAPGEDGGTTHVVTFTSPD